MPETPYHGWNTPIVGGDADVWGEKLNTILGVNELDADVIKKGPTTGTPPKPVDPPEKEGRWYLATDTTDPRNGNSTSLPHLFYDNGDQWITIWDGDAKTLGGAEPNQFARTDTYNIFTEGAEFYGNIQFTRGPRLTTDTTSNLLLYTDTAASSVILYDAVNSQNILNAKVGGDVVAENGRFVVQENTFRVETAANDVMRFVDTSGGSNTNPFTYRFDDRGFRLFAGGTGGVGSALLVDHDSGDVSVPNGTVEDENGPLANTSDIPDVPPPSEQLRTCEFQIQTVPDGGDFAESRVRVPSGKSLNVIEVGVQTAAGSTSADYFVEVRDGSDNYVAGSSSKYTDYSGAPPAIGGADDVRFKLVNNSSSGSADLTGYIHYTIT
ncbi:hypothetical protein [Halomarina oriensis]|uniref:Uncharacterized protein n=1 Tax=Halomarina oriensis TaxID=671145 RepID=A0A6B0GIW3_9EURY|nr:hypothetical protein [Halomarina oriensis]MWG34816.1 hypothetical protein [Halomarina oriensis]